MELAGVEGRLRGPIGLSRSKMPSASRATSTRIGSSRATTSSLRSAVAERGAGTFHDANKIMFGKIENRSGRSCRARSDGVLPRATSSSTWWSCWRWSRLSRFYVINLPPGSWVETYAIQLDSSGSPASAAQLAYITERYGLDRPLYEQYLRWIVPIVTRGRLRLLLRVAAAGLGACRRQAPPHHCRFTRLPRLRLCRLDTGRAAFGHAPVLRFRLLLLLPRHHRARDAELPSRPRPPRHVRPRLRRHADRPVLARVPDGAVVARTSGSI